MPLILPSGLPAIKELREVERIEVAGQSPARPLRVGIINLMPLKEMTERDFIRHLSATPLPVEIELIAMRTHRSLNTSATHLDSFYNYYNTERHYDGLIITGAPVEKIAFEEVDYWPELCKIMDHAQANIASTLYICWGAFAGLYHHHGINKHILDRKISGVFPHKAHVTNHPLLRGLDDEFYVPHSRYTTLRADEVAACEDLTVISSSEQGGIHIVEAAQGREFFITGHSEYAPLTLDFEYHRDLDKGINPDIPANYYPDDNPDSKPIVRWRSAASLLFANWLHSYVNPASPHRPKTQEPSTAHRRPQEP